jgi:hypothetical protein
MQRPRTGLSGGSAPSLWKLCHISPQLPAPHRPPALSAWPSASGLTVRCFQRPVLCTATSPCGRTGVRAGCDLVRSGVRQPVPMAAALGGTAAALLPQPRRSCPLVGCASGHRPAGGRAADSGCLRPVPHRRSVSEPMPHDGHPQRRRCGRGVRRWCPAAGRVDRCAETPTMTVPARRTCERSVSASRGYHAARSDSGGTCGGHPGTVPLLPSGWLPGVSDICGQPAASRHGRRPDVATGSGRRGVGCWWDGATAGRRGQAGRSGGRGAGRGRGSSPGG